MNPIDLVFLLLFFGVIWFLMIKPQVDEKRSHDELVASLAKGDSVVTSSGIWGRIAKVDEDTVVLEIGDKTKVTLDKVAVSRRVEGGKK